MVSDSHCSVEKASFSSEMLAREHTGSVNENNRRTCSDPAQPLNTSAKNQCNPFSDFIIPFESAAIAKYSHVVFIIVMSFRGLLNTNTVHTHLLRPQGRFSVFCSASLTAWSSAEMQIHSKKKKIQKRQKRAPEKGLLTRETPSKPAKNRQNSYTASSTHFPTPHPFYPSIYPSPPTYPGVFWASKLF